MRRTYNKNVLARNRFFDHHAAFPVSIPETIQVQYTCKRRGSEDPAFDTHTRIQRFWIHEPNRSVNHPVAVSASDLLYIHQLIVITHHFRHVQCERRSPMGGNSAKTARSTTIPIDVRVAHYGTVLIQQRPYPYPRARAG